MTRKSKLFRLAIFLPIIFFTSCSHQNISLPDKNLTITILHTNDMHGAIESVYDDDGNITQIGADYIKALKYSKENSILIDAGDATQGNLFAQRSKGKNVMKIMKAAGFNIMALGNHEFDYGQAILKENISESGLEVISANVLNQDHTPFLKNEKNNGCHIIKEIDGKKIGFFALTTSDTPHQSNPDNLEGLHFQTEAETAIQQVEILKKQHCDAIIAIAHTGSKKSAEIATIPDINIILDGHSHEKYSTNIGQTFIQQTGSSSKAIGEITLTFTPDGKFVISPRIIEANQFNALGLHPDEQIRKMCEDEKEECRKLYSQVIGKIDQTLYGGNYENVNINKLYDSNLAQLVQDACIFAVNKLVPKTNSDIVALGGGGGVRKRINSGNATRGDILNAFPFENRLLVKKISPKNIYEVLKPGFKTLYKDNGILKGENNAFPCVGGMRVEVTIPKSSPNLGDSDSSPIQKVVLLDSNGKDKKELNRDDDKPELLLAINDFMAQGGDGYPTFDKYETIAKGNEPTGDVLIHYIEHLTKEYGSIKGYPANMSRIKFIDISSGNYSAEISVSEKFNPDQVTVDGHTTSEWHIMAGGKVIVKDLSSGPHSISAWSNNSHQEFYVNNQIGILKASIYS